MKNKNISYTEKYLNEIKINEIEFIDLFKKINNLLLEATFLFKLFKKKKYSKDKILKRIKINKIVNYCKLIFYEYINYNYLKNKPFYINEFLDFIITRKFKIGSSIEFYEIYKRYNRFILFDEIPILQTNILEINYIIEKNFARIFLISFYDKFQFHCKDLLLANKKRINYDNN